MNWEELNKVNQEIETIGIINKVRNNKGGYDYVTTQYAEVKSRVLAFRRLFPHGCINTEVLTDDKYVLATASVYQPLESGEKVLLATGHAREPLSKQFALENAESSAVGRALGFVGIGVIGGIATADDMKNLNESDVFDVEPRSLNDLVREFESLYDAKNKANILNGLHITKPEEMGIDLLQKYIDYAKK